MIKKTLISVFAILALGVLLLIVTGYGYILTGISRTYLVGNATANINDYPQFDTRIIKSGTPEEWPLSPHYRPTNKLPNELVDYMQRNNGVAFLVAYKGQLLAEHYAESYNNSSQTNSFSMAKTVVTLLLAEAIEEGYIRGLDQPITDFLPEYFNDPNGKLATIGSLSSMTSGYNWDEQYYSPFSPTVELLYGDDIEEFVLSREFNSTPESKFYYSSASTQLLALVISRALKTKNPKAALTDYLSEKLWKPLGMNADAPWHTDGNGAELAFCCINTNARNYAKLGQLMLQKGQWNGQQLINADFIKMMHTPKSVPYYGYSTWINNEHKPSYYAFRGHLGQFIMVVPDKELVVIRLGESQPQSTQSTEHFFIEQALKMIDYSNPSPQP